LAKKLYGDGIRVWEHTPWHATQRAAWEALKKRAAQGLLSVLRCQLFAAVQLTVFLSLVSPATGGAPERDDLDRIWNEHMIEGKAALIILDKSSEATQELGQVSALPGGRLKASLLSPGIVVRRVGKGIWTNGGWVLQGGLAGEVQLGSVTFELFGKEVIRRIPYFPFPFHRDPPHETGCEIFLVRREQRAVRRTIVREWVFSPKDVKLSEYGSTNISATVTREPNSEAMIVIAVHGLQSPFAQRIDLTDAIKMK
jgi:hypothetical protein